MPESRVLSNPADIAIAEQQKQQRLEQAKALAEKVEAEKNLPPQEFWEPYTFRFRKIKSGSFQGLWELAVIRPNGKIDEIVYDANALPECLEAIGNIFANKGY